MEYDLSHSPAFKDKRINILIPAISIIVETEGSLRIVGDFLEEAVAGQGAAPAAGTPGVVTKKIVFVDGFLDENQERIIERKPGVYGGYNFKHASVFGGTDKIKRKLSALLPADISKILYKNDFRNNFRHTEQLLHLYLFDMKKYYAKNSSDTPKEQSVSKYEDP